MTTHKLKSGDLLLLLLYVKGKKDVLNEPICGRTRLLKMIVAFEEELYSDFVKDNDILNKADLPEFFAWNFGPMSIQVLEDLEFFRKIKFIESKKVYSGVSNEAEEISAIFDDLYLDDRNDTEYIEEEYSLSDIGQKYVEQKIININILTDNQIGILQKLKKQFNSASLDDIIAYIYNNKKYEKYIKKDKSKIYEKYKINK